MSNIKRSLVQQLLPPLVYNWLEQQLKKRKYPLYNSYAEALAKCSEKGYENDTLIEVISYKMALYLENQKKSPDLQITPTQSYTLLSLAKLLSVYPNRKKFNIIDFGGSLGGHYFDIKRIFKDSIQLNWAVVETTAMSNAGKQFANDELSFFDNLPAALKHLGSLDLLYTSGTLQCVDQPYNFLETLIATNARFILFNRLGLNRKNRDVITIHHSKLSWNGHPGLPPGVEDRIIRYPFTYISERDFLNHLSKRYNIISQFNEDSGIFSLSDEEIIGGGMLVEIK